ncbi:MAG: mycofactocin precursor MftA [Mycobacterium sp.]|jgi:mycofactocin precursor
MDHETQTDTELVTEAVVEQTLVEQTLVEEVSIDGMCGVY